MVRGPYTPLWVSWPSIGGDLGQTWGILSRWPAGAFFLGPLWGLPCALAQPTQGASSQDPLGTPCGVPLSPSRVSLGPSWGCLEPPFGGHLTSMRSCTASPRSPVTGSSGPLLGPSEPSTGLIDCDAGERTRVSNLNGRGAAPGATRACLTSKNSPHSRTRRNALSGHWGSQGPDCRAWPGNARSE